MIHNSEDMVENKKVDKRNRIIKAATKIFANNGFYKAKISQIAHMADVADGTIYLYFKSKDDILISIFEEEMSQIIEHQKESISKESDAESKLILFAENHANMVINDVDLAAFFQLEIRQSSKFMKNYNNKQFANYLNLISDIIQKGIKGNEFISDINVHLVKHSYFGAIDEISTQWILLDKDKKFDLKASLNSFAQIFIRGIKK